MDSNQKSAKLDNCKNKNCIMPDTENLINKSQILQKHITKRQYKFSI